MAWWKSKPSPRSPRAWWSTARRSKPGPRKSSAGATGFARRRMPRRLDTGDPGFATAFAALLGDKRESAADVDADVRAILADVRARGDKAVIEYTKRFDGFDLTPKIIRFSAEEIRSIGSSESR